MHTNRYIIIVNPPHPNGYRHHSVVAVALPSLLVSLPATGFPHDEDVVAAEPSLPRKTRCQLADRCLGLFDRYRG